jgi:anti-sigma factor RsiW
MTHEEIKNALSAYMDGELESAQKSEIERHLGTCSTCTAELKELRQVASEFKKTGAEKLPPHIRAMALAQSQAAEPKKQTARQSPGAFNLVLVVAAMVILVLIFGMTLKHMMPTLFSSVSGSITGAASTLGASTSN